MIVNYFRDQVEMALAELEVILGVSNRLLDTHEDLSTFLQQFTKAVAETPFRFFSCIIVNIT
jgi:menaquinone-dependent protoporphyrinogen IX oxidase